MPVRAKSQLFCQFLLFVIAVVGIVRSTPIQHGSNNKPNNRVIIGVLAQDYDVERTNDSFIPASYVKYVENGGARVVPIFINKPKSYYQKLVTQINGILLPGGENTLTDSGFAKTANLLLDLAIEINKNGIYFPVWGTCASFEIFVIYFSQNTDWATLCNGEAVMPAEHLDMEEVNASRMFKGGEHIVKILSTERVTAHFHHICLTVEKFNELKLNQQFRLLSTNQLDNQTMVSIVESRQYPFYATSWHPEMNLFEFMDTYIDNHSAGAVLLSQWLSNFVINEARKNQNRFSDKRSEQLQLIYRYSDRLEYSGLDGDFYEQIYRFPKDIN